MSPTNVTLKSLKNTRGLSETRRRTLKNSSSLLPSLTEQVARKELSHDEGSDYVIGGNSSYRSLFVVLLLFASNLLLYEQFVPHRLTVFLRGVGLSKKVWLS